jgi:hypothetical protein
MPSERERKEEGKGIESSNNDSWSGKRSVIHFSLQGKITCPFGATDCQMNPAPTAETSIGGYRELASMIRPLGGGDGAVCPTPASKAGSPRKLAGVVVSGHFPVE